MPHFVNPHKLPATFTLDTSSQLPRPLHSSQLPRPLHTMAVCFSVNKRTLGWNPKPNPPEKVFHRCSNKPYPKLLLPQNPFPKLSLTARTLQCLANKEPPSLASFDSQLQLLKNKEEDTFSSKPLISRLMRAILTKIDGIIEEVVSELDFVIPTLVCLVALVGFCLWVYAKPVLLVAMVYIVWMWFTYCEEKMKRPTFSILQLQVGIHGMKETLHKDFLRISKSSKPWGYILKATTRSLSWHLDHCMSCLSYGCECYSADCAKKHFMDISVDNHVKFDEEILTIISSTGEDNTRQSLEFEEALKLCNNHPMVTILVAVSGGYKWPTITSFEDLEEALEILHSIPHSSILALEVFWAPQRENNSLSESKLKEIYPYLTPI